MGLVIRDKSQDSAVEENASETICNLEDLTKNCLIVGNNKTYTVVQVYPNQNQLAISLHKKRPTKPILINFDEGIEGNDWSNYKRQPNTFSSQPCFANPNNKAWGIANERFEAIRPIIGSRELNMDSQIEAYIRGYLSTEFMRNVAVVAPTQQSKVGSESPRLIAESRKPGVSIQSLYAWINRFLMFGSNKAGLLSNYNVCGTFRILPIDAEDALVKLAQRGGHFIGCKITSLARKQRFRRDTNQQDIVRLHSYLDYDHQYCIDYKVTSVHAHFTNKKCYDTANLFDSDEPVSYLNLSKYMSYDQFRYYYKKLVDLDKLEELKTSTKQAYNDNARKRGIAQQNSIGPSELYEIDSTTLNMYVVSRVNASKLKMRPKVLGRPYLYFVVDVYSGMIVGYCITFSRNSMAAKRALYNAFTNKVEHCARYGIKISQDDWPCHHVCRRLLCDRGGEYFKGLFSDALESDLGWEGISYTPAYLSRGKGTVEVNFNAVDGFVIQRLPGKVKPNPAKDAAHPSNYARVTIDELHRLVIESILSFNRSRVNFNRLNSFDILTGLEPNPINIWNEYIGQKMGGGIVKPREQVQYAMLQQGSAKVTRDFIALNTDKYSLKYRTTDHDFQNLQQKLKDENASFELTVRFNPDDPRYIWCAVPKFEGRIVQFEIAVEDRRFDYLHEREIKDRVLIETAIRSISRQHRELENVDMYRKITQEMERLNSIKTPKKTPKGIVKNINDNFKDAAVGETVLETRLIQELFDTSIQTEVEESADV
jgi:hypothetical protein